MEESWRGGGLRLGGERFKLDGCGCATAAGSANSGEEGKDMVGDVCEILEGYPWS